MKQIDIQLFRDCCALNFTVRRWSNRKTVKLTKEECEREGLDPDRATKSFKLTCSRQYANIVKYQNETKAWLRSRSMPSFFKVGIFMIKLDELDNINAKLNTANATIRTVMVPDLIADIKSVETVDRQALGRHYDLQDYPQEQPMLAKFGFIWLPIQFGVPENLPQQLFDEAQKKATAMWEEAQEKILITLRLSFAKLVDHAVERLKVDPGEKAKTFKKSTIQNIKDFLETFNQKNIMNDGELAKLVAKAEKVMAPVDDAEQFAVAMRNDDALRERMTDQLEGIKMDVEKMIVERPRRSFIMADVEED